MKYFIANWKANKTVHEAVSWVTAFAEILRTHPNTVELMRKEQIKVIICPSMPYIFYVKQILNEFHVSFGVQDISMFDAGKHTGEVAAAQLKGSIEYSIIGHSERRIQMKETEDQIKLKIDSLQKNSIHPILCFRNENDILHESAPMVAFEPIEAIGTGLNMKVSDVLDKLRHFSLKAGQAFLYGGSVSSEDCKEYLGANQIDGFLIGTSSLDPVEFFKIIEQYNP